MNCCIADRKPDLSSLLLERCHKFCHFFSDKLVNIASKIDEHLKSLSLPLLPHINFDEAVAFASFSHVSDVDVYKIISTCPVKTSPLDFILITVLLLNRAVIFLVFC